MKKQVDNKLAALIIFILVVIILVALYYAIGPERIFLNNDYKNDYKEVTKKVVVVKVENTGSVLVIDDKEKYPSLTRVYVGNDREYRIGNELLVHFNGIILESYPGQFSGITKIEFIKEKSDIEIPESILSQCYSSPKNTRVTINKLTNSGITFSIVDANEYPYNYSHKYTILKKVKNENYPEKVQKIGEDTKNSIAGYTRNRYRIFF